jgi:TPR repeat protein
MFFSFKATQGRANSSAVPPTKCRREMTAGIMNCLRALLTALVLIGPSPISEVASAASTKQKAEGSSPIKQRVFRRGITRTAQLPTASLRASRARMVAKKRVSFAELRSLADAGDGLAAYFLAKRIEERNDPTLASDAAHYYALAAYSGRQAGVRPLVRLLKASGSQISPTRLAHVEVALAAQARSGNLVAIEALAGFYEAGTPFGQKPAEARDLYLQLAQHGDSQAAFDLAVSLLQQSPEDEDRRRIRRLLDIAAQSETPGLRATAQTLIRQLESGSVPTAEQVSQ